MFEKQLCEHRQRRAIRISFIYLVLILTFIYECRPFRKSNEYYCAYIKYKSVYHAYLFAEHSNQMTGNVHCFHEHTAEPQWAVLVIAVELNLHCSHVDANTDWITANCTRGRATTNWRGSLMTRFSAAASRPPRRRRGCRFGQQVLCDMQKTWFTRARSTRCRRPGLHAPL